jgi:hypothetical protein
LRSLIDDAAVFPPGNAPLPDAVVAHRQYRAAWFADLVGPLLVPASSVDDLAALVAPGERLSVGLIGDTGIDGLPSAIAALNTDKTVVRQVEVAVAKRGEDPQPGIADLVALLADTPHLDGYAETPLTWGLLAALDAVVAARDSGVRIAAKFRTGGLAAELFPTTLELAAVICACRDRRLPFKLTAGLHHALRYVDPETGFTHHGFLNVLVGSIAAADGAEPADVAELLSSTDPVPLFEVARSHRDSARPLWVGFGTCSIEEPLDDLRHLGLIQGDAG